MVATARSSNLVHMFVLAILVLSSPSMHTAEGLGESANITLQTHAETGATIKGMNSHRSHIMPHSESDTPMSRSEMEVSTTHGTLQSSHVSSTPHSSGMKPSTPSVQQLRIASSTPYSPTIPLPLSYQCLFDFFALGQKSFPPSCTNDLFIRQGMDNQCSAFAFCNRSQSLVPYQSCHVLCKGYCRCTDNCAIYHDCCVDILLSAKHMEGFSFQNTIECTPNSLKIPGTNYGYALMVVKCPSTFRIVSVRNKCESISMKTSPNIGIPITDSVTAITYRNRYCAQCHGISEHNFKLWELKSDCESRLVVQDFRTINDFWRRIISDTNCDVWVSGSDNEVHECFGPSAINECNVTGQWSFYEAKIKDGCHFSEYSQVMIDHIIYSNLFCAICNGKLLPDVIECSEQGGAIRPIGSSLISLLDFYSKPNDKSQNRTCEADELFIPLKSKCLPVFCPQGQLFDAGACRALLMDDAPATYIVNLGYQHNGSISFKEVTTLTNKVLKHFIKLISMNFGDILKVTVRAYAADKEDLGEKINNPVIEIHIKIRLLADGSLNSIMPKLSRPLFFEWVLSLTEQVLVLKADKSKINIVQDRTNTPDSDATLFPHNHNLCEKYEKGGVRFENLNPKESYLVHELSDRRTPSFLKQPEYFVFKDLNCSYVKITISYNKNKNMFNKLPDTSFQMCVDIVKVCTGVAETLITSLSLSPSSVLEVAESSVSLIATILSLLSLLVTFIVYCKQKRYDTLPGKNTMALVVTMFFAQLIYKIGPSLVDISAFCVTFGIVVHFLWLSVFCWMNVSAFHMFKVFVNPFGVVSHSDKQQTTFRRYILYATLAPVVVIVICIVVNLVNTDCVSSGYGGSACYIKVPLHIGIFFAVPIGLIILTNLIFFVLTVHEFNRMARNETILKSSDRNYALISFKLSAVLGFTWIFGFLAIFTKSQTLIFIFEILNGSQGMFIFISFCVTKAMCRDCYGGKLPESTVVTNKTNQSL